MVREIEIEIEIDNSIEIECKTALDTGMQVLKRYAYRLDRNVVPMNQIAAKEDAIYQPRNASVSEMEVCALIEEEKITSAARIAVARMDFAPA